MERSKLKYFEIVFSRDGLHSRKPHCSIVPRFGRRWPMSDVSAKVVQGNTRQGKVVIMRPRQLKVRLGLDQHSICPRRLNKSMLLDASQMIGAARCAGSLVGSVHCGDHHGYTLFMQKDSHSSISSPASCAGGGVGVVIIQGHINHAFCFHCTCILISLPSRRPDSGA